MGTNCARSIAMVYCFTYGIVFLRRKVDEGNYDTANRLLRVEGCINDLLSIGILGFDSVRRLPEGVYHKDNLELNMEDEGMRVPFMVLFIRQQCTQGLIPSMIHKPLEKYCNFQACQL